MFRSADLVVAIVTFIVGAGALAFVPSEVGGETLAAIGDMNSPAFFPILAGCMIVICATGLAVKAVRDLRGDAALEIEFRRRVLVSTVMAIFVLFATATHYMGMFPAAVATIVLMAVLLGYRNFVVLIPVAVATPTAVYLLFERTLFILLPRGVLFQ